MQVQVDSSRNRYVLVVDEAGFVGYTDKDEREPGEFGLAAGVLYLESEESRLAEMVKRAAFRPKPGCKLHITDLEEGEHVRLRSFLEDLLTAENDSICLFYYAVSVAGYHGQHQRQKELAANANATRRSKVKIAGAGRIEPDWLLKEVYRNVILDAIACCVDRHEDGDYHLTVRCDRTPAKLLASLKSEVVSLLAPTRQATDEVTGYDPTSKQIVKGAVVMTWVLPPSLHIHCSPENLFVDGNPPATELALLPDAVASWIEFVLKQAVAVNSDAPLNDEQSLRNFPLRRNIYSFSRTTTPHHSDTLFARKYRRP